MATIPLHPTEHETDLIEAPAAPPDEPALRFNPERGPVHELRQFEQNLPGGPEPWHRRLAWLRNLALFVLLPTLAVAIFEYGVVANQYESETHFVIRTAGQSGSAGSGLGQLLGLDPNPTAADSQTVVDYLLSHDAVASLERSVGLRAMFRRPDADIFSRLADNAPPETLLRYYRTMVDVEVGRDAGITRVAVRGFRGADAQRLAEALLVIGERRVNEFNKRLLESRLAAARESLQAAEAGVSDTQAALSGLRESARDADPERTSAARIAMVTQMQSDLAQARARLAGMAAAVRPDSPQYVAQAAQVRAIEQQVGAAQASLTGSAQATASGLGRFEGIRFRQELAAKRYEAATAALDTAREQALRQQLYLVRIVEPNAPGKALYPKRMKLIGTVFFALLLAYAIGWLILAGVREHAA
ncbi:capsule biosynthesis protein [Sphingomonas sp. KR3-1]|uniref:capsule biosynthesis protein n=1 Tax=Sphingomonas sp. KR3-1 TaxID=3156611 RepID=UPI0032B4BD44